MRPTLFPNPCFLMPWSIFAAMLFITMVMLIIAAFKTLARRERSAPPPPVLDEFDANVTRMNQRVANLEEILLNANRPR